MRINHNIAALNTYRQLAANGANSQKSLEKLSSGLGINKAGDNAAGLAISEKMRGQIRGLDQASRNAQDGISFIQTAEGAMNETHSILQRMRELAVQSSNDTNIAIDRGEIQKEIDQLAQEITRIANNTEFNQQTLLNGGITKAGIGETTFHIGANEGQNINLSINAMDAKSLGVARDFKTTTLDESATGVTAIKVEDTTTLAGSKTGTVHAVNVADVAAINAKASVGTDIEIGAKALGAFVADSGNGIKVNLTINAGLAADANGTASYDSATGVLTITSKAGTAASINAAIANITGDAAAADFEASGTGTSTGSTNAEMIGGEAAKLKFTVGTNSQTVDADATKVNFANLGLTLTKDATKTSASDFTNVNVTVTSVEAEAASKQADGTMSKAVANAGINVSSQPEASKAITVIQKAIETVSAERSKLGAFQNRLEHTINNLSTSSENLTAAESRVRDVDMAKEMMEFTKNNILSQAAQAMLAQANAQPQGVLQLLR